MERVFHYTIETVINELAIRGYNMELTYQAYNGEIEELIHFLSTNRWEFHGNPSPDPEKLREAYNNHTGSDDDTKTFWIILDGQHKVGLIKIFDLNDDTPLFDIRL